MALASAGMITVIFSYILLISLAVGFIALPFILFLFLPGGDTHFIYARLMLSAFGIVAGFIILSSLLSTDSPLDLKGILIDLTKERRLAREIRIISAALNEPMPSEVYLVADANAFAMEAPGKGGSGKRRIMGLGLPWLQMLSIAQFRAVLTHEFGHYYSGDTSTHIDAEPTTTTSRKTAVMTPVSSSPGIAVPNASTSAPPLKRTHVHARRSYPRLIAPGKCW